MTSTYDNKDFAENYDRVLTLPLVRTLRRQERDGIWKLLEPSLRESDKVLEVGAGTGAYTFDIAKRVRHVVAQEPSSSMLTRLSEKLRERSAKNVTTSSDDIMTFSNDDLFDYVVTIGVLDYVKDWENFLQKCLCLSKRGLLFTVPQRGGLSQLYRIISRLSHLEVFSYTAMQIEQALRPNHCEILEVDFPTKISKGMLLVVNATK